ncbi:MAG TPA: hypothetical protein VGG71_05180, partial [Chitinophagaceae bacterium]
IPVSQPEKGKMIVQVNEPEIRYSGNFWWKQDNNDNMGWDITDDTLRYNNIKIRYDKSNDSSYHVKVFKYSAGSTLRDAQNRAERTVFNISSHDDILNMGSGLAVDRQAKFRGQGVIVEIDIPVGKKIRFDESVMQAYDPWVIRRSWREGRYWGRRWQSDWDYDEYFDLKPDVDYVMGSDGKLLNSEEQSQTGDKKENLRKNIRESQKKIEEEQRKIDENKQKLNDTIPARQTKAETRNVRAVATATIYPPLSMATLFN